MKITFFAFKKLIGTPKYDWDWISHHSEESSNLDLFELEKWSEILSPKCGGLKTSFKGRKSQG